jgi:hypothetical protein
MLQDKGLEHIPNECRLLNTPKLAYFLQEQGKLHLLDPKVLLWDTSFLID